MDFACCCCCCSFCFADVADVLFVLLPMSSSPLPLSSSQVLREQSSEQRMLTRQAAVLIQPLLARMEKQRPSTHGDDNTAPGRARRGSQSAAPPAPPAPTSSSSSPSAVGSGAPPPEEFPAAEGGGVPGWIVLLKMTIVREIQTNAQLSHIWSLVTKCPRVYFPYRQVCLLLCCVVNV